MSIAVRAFDPTADRAALERLWAETLDTTWPLDPDALEVIRDGLVAERRGQVVGLAAVNAESIPLLLVAPPEQRTGVGSALHAATLELLRERGAERMSLGRGGEDHLWPGVPANLSAAVAFFEAHGWTWDHVAIDLVRDLRGYVDPIGAVARAADGGINLALAGAADVSAVLAFEEATSPNGSIPSVAGTGRYSPAATPTGRSLARCFSAGRGRSRRFGGCWAPTRQRSLVSVWPSRPKEGASAPRWSRARRNCFATRVPASA